MKGHEIDFAIAQIVGALHHRWKEPKGDIAIGGYVDLQCEDCFQFGSEDPDNQCPLAAIPNYSRDLNAMHKAEKTLTCEDSNESESYKYADLLWPKGEKHNVLFRFVTSPARQRAEAFLRVKGKWKE